MFYTFNRIRIPIQYGTEAAGSTSEEMLGFNSWQR